MNRRELLQMAAIGGAGAILGPARAQASEDPASTTVPHAGESFAWEEASIGQLQEAMQSGKATSVSIVKQYLDRIAAMDKSGPAVNAIIELNPDASAIAQALDEERKSKEPRGPLHGVPVLIKDNIDTHDRMMTTAGSLALLGSIAPRDSFVAQRLREAGAVILGKANLSEWANFRANSSSSGWSGRGGQTKNPYALDRNPSGSSSGSAAAVSSSFCAVAVGTETNGSIISPSTVCGIVGIKPTVGLISRAGIIPISRTQDTAGPMARSVRDAAILLGALAGVDPRDSVTEESRGKSHADYTQFLDADGLRGARLGIARRTIRGNAKARAVIEAAIETLKKMGAVLIDPADIPAQNRLGSSEGDLLQYEFKAGLNEYLAGLGPNAPVHSLAEIIEFNTKNADRELPFFGQETFLRSQERGPLTDKAYLDALANCRRFSRAEGIDALMDEQKLDAIVAPSGGPAGVTDLLYGNRDVGGSSSPAAIAGYPSITVPAGNMRGLPLGISFFGRAYSEPVLLKIAYAFEQASKARITPKFLATLG
ncbi:MAG TPA: amidase [Humisphaera sp.]|jgi:amidase|nr:amidase [Humisphaera sp.]